ncbi:hypothetical protein I352_05946 [Cryptococcus deuterogattii MMRL2647]|nr:hypothetical protein I352_05946 [Cryptococcus deuterogattii MMRL2647]
MSSSTSTSSTTSATASASRSAAGIVDSSSNPAFKIVGICLAVGSGFLIGTSFVIKKKGLIKSTEKYGNQAGEGHGYLKSWMWWAGMLTMIVGEICNFVAYAFTEAILVTPMGALSVVVAAILSHFLLKEKLTFFGWIGCTLCIMGAVIIALNAPEEQSVTTINEFKEMFLSVGFLVWGSLSIAASLVVVFFVAPKYGKKNMMPYISICSLIGGISVSCTQGLGASILTSIQGDNQVKNWFFWFLFVFVIVTLLTEINYLNKALELFNTSMVVPVYFCFFTSATLITSFILYKGLKASAVTLITMVLGFLVTCLGITLLQLSKVDPKELGNKLDRKSTILMEASRHQTEDAEKGQVSSYEDPGMDALRGGFGAVGSIIRARSVNRRMSNASTLSGGKYGAGNLSTHGLEHLPRFQLSDNPMPSDAMSQISLHSAKSPTILSGKSFRSSHDQYPSPQRSKNIKFEEGDIVHQYHYNQGPDRDAMHAYRPFSADHHNGYHHSSGPIYPPVMEEDEDAYEKEVEAKGEKGSSRTKVHVDGASEEVLAEPLSHNNPYAIYPARANVPQVRRPSGTNKGLSGLFSFHSGPDLSLHIPHINRNRDDKDEKSPRRDHHDYPVLSKKDRNNAQEREERQALVGGDDDESGGRKRSDSTVSSSLSNSDGETRESEQPQSAVSTKATIGMGTRVQIGQDTPARQAAFTLTGTTGIVPEQGKSSRRLPDLPGFAAGPLYETS